MRVYHANKSIQITEEQMWLLYGALVERAASLEDAYDVFVSYRWGKYDQPLAEGIYESMGCQKYVITDEFRAIKTFLDKWRLQDGRNFRDDFGTIFLFISFIFSRINLTLSIFFNLYYSCCATELHRSSFDFLCRW